MNLETQWGTSDVMYGRELAMNGPVWEQSETWRTQNPVRFAAQFKTPMLLSVGERDYRVPLNNTLEMWALLQRLQVPSRLLVWPEEKPLDPQRRKLGAVLSRSRSVAPALGDAGGDVDRRESRKVSKSQSLKARPPSRVSFETLRL